MGLDLNEILKQREQKGIYISYSIDIRKVEGFLKNIFGKKDDTEDKQDGSEQTKDS